MVIRFKLEAVRRKAETKPAGYYEKMVGAGRVDGEWLEFTEKAYRSLYSEYNPPQGPGDWLAWIFARLGFKKCKDCARRATWLNRLFRRK